ncbi:MAG TPA: LysM peptidoglycan-binding domain-containing protein [bacterium]
MIRRSIQIMAVICGLVLLTPALSSAAQSYTVQPGDTLWAIASRFGVPVEALIAANHLPNPDALKLGLRLVIPSSGTDRTAAPAAAARSGDLTHIVVDGDTLWSIAARHDVSVDAIIAANRLGNPDALKLGQKLIIPARRNAQTAARQPAAARPAVARPAAVAQRSVWHTVAGGDTLWTIAVRYHTTVAAVIAANTLRNPDALTLGQRLKIPVAASVLKPVVKPAVATPKPAATPSKPAAVVHAPNAPAAGPAPAAPTVLRQVPPLRALPRSVVAPVRLLPRSAIPSRGERWASALQQVAVRVLGVRYRWGGMSVRGFDCSGFVNYVMNAVGVRVPRTTFAMFRSGRPVARNQLQVGDVVFFQTVCPGPCHAGIYIGNNLFMHSGSGIGRVSITSLNYSYYKARYLGARRF